ncbi:Lipase_(Class 3) and transmembrane domain-containing protein [Hexamita inflata]|uniref:sn-1-specific diacylglycerol lipase n=1 Tax=Hexamita inflata TaxID=28002 RepID=A0ABP1HJ12_9EUKA
MQLQLMSEILDSLKVQLDATGIKSLLNWIWLTLKIGRQPIVWTKNFDHYQNYSQLTDYKLLRELQRTADISTELSPYRVYEYYKSERFSFAAMFKTYLQDSYDKKLNYISLSKKKGRLSRQKYNVVLDHADESNYSKPAFFVIKNGDLITIIVRGTANKSDKMIDIDAKPEYVDGMYVHSGFYWHAQTIFQDLELENLISDSFTYVTTGHSMGGAVSCLLGYLLYQYFLQSSPTPKVTSYGYGMACVGCIKFSKYCSKFCTTVVNGFDSVPAFSFHSMKVQMERLLHENNKKFMSKSQLVKVNQQIKDGQIMMQNPRLGETANLNLGQIFETLSQNPTSREISERCVAEDDLFPAGIIYHYIKGKFFQISVHDISEISLSIPSIFDHFGYVQMVRDIGIMLDKQE